MNLSVLTVGVSTAVWFCTVAHSQGPPALVKVIPEGDALGASWQRSIEVLIDPASETQVLQNPERMSKATLNEWRRAAKDTNQTVSAWSHAHYDYVSPKGTNRYYLHIERYHSQGRLNEEFSKLMVSHRGTQRSVPRRGIGDAAVVTYDPEVVALRYLRGQFRVTIYSFGGTPTGENDGSMMHLAKAVDRCITQSYGQNRNE